jgi:nucleotide-binding universal stress UspA family protein
MIENMKILVGVDGSPSAYKALSEAIGIAKKFSGSITVIVVHWEARKNIAEEIMERSKGLCATESVECTAVSVIGASPAREIRNMARTGNFDLVIVGNKGLGKTASMLLGSVSREVVAIAECNVLVVKK